MLTGQGKPRPRDGKSKGCKTRIGTFERWE